MRKALSTKLLIAFAMAVSTTLHLSTLAQPVADPAAGGTVAGSPLTNNPASGNVSAPSTDGTAPAPKPKHKVKKPAAKADQKISTFDGKLGAVDKTAMTITVEGTNKQTLKITSNTHINKDGKPALLSDGKISEDVSGQFVKSAGGAEEATVVNFGVRHTTPIKRKHKPSQPKAKTETPDGLTPGTDTNQPPATTEPLVPPATK